MGGARTPRGSALVMGMTQEQTVMMAARRLGELEPKGCAEMFSAPHIMLNEVKPSVVEL